jgi:hypothetical protein
LIEATNLRRLPSVVVCFNMDRKEFPLAEFYRARIISLGFVDTNINPFSFFYSIPGNDDSFNSIAFYSNIFFKVALRARNMEMLSLKVKCRKLRGFFVKFFFRKFSLFLLFFCKFFLALRKLNLFKTNTRTLQLLALNDLKMKEVSYMNFFKLLLVLCRK